jgi:hypothetical protein
VYKGHPYCEACHVRLRMPKCKHCKKSIRDGMRAVEALGGKWCWECFVCEVCDFPCFHLVDTDLMPDCAFRAAKNRLMIHRSFCAIISRFASHALV